MSYSAPAPTTTRRSPGILVAGVLLVIAAIVAARGFSFPTPASPTAASPAAAVHLEERGAPAADSEQRRSLPPRSEAPGALAPRADDRGDVAARRDRRGALVPPGERPAAVADADGAIPEGTTVFDDEIRGVANLDPSLLRALRRAATDAADDGVELFVNSGWRSPEYQEKLFLAAVSTYGSEREAARWVASPNTSAHVSGDAVDIGFAGTAWLSRRGAEYGLCQIYRNELWHYELRREAVDRGCPPMYADPSQDPRMQQ